MTEHATIELCLSGPYPLLPTHPDTIFRQAEAWRPGIFVWAFLYNQAYRICRVGAADESVGATQAGLLAALLEGRLLFHDAAARERGEPRVAFTPGGPREDYLARADDLAAEVSALAVFFAPLDDAGNRRTRIAAAVNAHIQRLGGKALDWLSAVSETGSDTPAEQLVVRFYRPALMISMPDELRVG